MSIIKPLSTARRHMVSTVKSIMPPVKGWNARDDLADMDPDEAIVLDNIIPADRRVVTRGGYTEWLTGLGEAAITLLSYSSPTTDKMFVATASDIYDASTSGAVGAAAVTTLSNGIWSQTMFATAGGHYLVAVNGADGVRTYDGSSWATQTITGATAANFVTVTSHMNRLWFVEDNTLKVWYLGTSAVSGAATSINLAQRSKLGGYLVAMASWTLDGGAGMEDVAVFVTSKGEVHLFRGTDPSSDTTWSAVGTFKIAEPIGRRCMIKVGGDIGILTSQGIVPLSGVLNKAQSAQANVAITDRIRNAYTAAYDDAPTANGWNITEYPYGKLLIVNIPIVESTTTMQFVMNSATGAWARWTDINANDWALMGTSLFFAGVDGTVYQYSGSTDNGANIVATCVSAYTEFGTARTKYFKRIRPQFQGLTGYQPSVGVAVDYSEDFSNVSAAPTAETQGTAWDAGDWDTTDWASSQQPSALWRGLRNKGWVGAIIVKFDTPEPMTYNGGKILFEQGDAL